MSACPHCGEHCEDLETTCRHCGRDLKEAAARELPQSPGAASTKTTAPVASAARLSNSQLVMVATAAIVVGAVAMTLVGRSLGVQPDAPVAVEPSADSSPSEAARRSSPARPRSKVPSAPKWSGSRQPRWARDGSRTISFELAAENYAPVWMKRVRPTLVVRCLSGTTDVLVITESAASLEPSAGRHTVRVGFDEGAEVEQQWFDSADYQALFAPDGIALAREIARARHMRFGFTPYNASPVVVDFDVTGFDELIDPVAKTCKWKR